MISSMTGYGRGESIQGEKTFIVEIKSVNHKYLDISIKSPRFLNSLEPSIIKEFKKHITRGKVDVYISYTSSGMDDKKLILDKELASEYVNILKDIKESFSINNEISLGLVSKFPDVVRIENVQQDEQELWDILLPALQNAIDKFIKMRQTEGVNLKRDIELRLENISKLLTKVEELSSKVVEEYKDKLSERINNILSGGTIDEQRLAMEVAIISDKSNITEEIVRLFSHIQQLKSTLSENNSIGKKLNFIVQEMNREANTINSKSSNIDLINTVLSIKTEIEKIREQIQNIE